EAGGKVVPGFGGPIELAHRDVETELAGQCGEPRGIVEHKERPIALAAHRPGFQAEFTADSGRLAHGDGERRGGGHGCLTSIVAWRRRSRMYRRPAPSRLFSRILWGVG